MSWFDNAACRGMDASVFYLDVGQNGAAARAVCARCPVVEACAVHAVSTHEPFGIWGGLSPRERGIHGYRDYQPPSHCPHGHLYDEENTWVTALGHRRCRACLAAGMRDYRRRLKETG